MAANISGWSNFLAEIVALTESSDRQQGIANLGYTEYVMERLLLCMNTCTSIKQTIEASDEAAVLQDYISSLSELITTLQMLYQKWEEYKSFLEGPAQHYLSLVRIHHHEGRGRPRFDVSRSQLEYLASLSFKWTEIACILGVSRMTLYRYVHVFFVSY